MNGNEVKKEELAECLPDQPAESKKTERSYNIGVVFEDAAKGGLTHDFFAGVLQGFKQRAEKLGYDVTFLNTGQQKMSYLERARRRNFDGLVIINFEYSDPKLQELLKSTMKIVTVDYQDAGHTAVVSDNVSGMYQLMQYILGKGHKRIAYICGDVNLVTGQRLKSYYKSLAERGLSLPPTYVEPGRYRDVGLAYQKTEELLDLEQPPTCILYPDDVACFGGIRAIHERGLRIPEDISVAGYDGTGALQLMDPPLTTFRQNTGEMGRLAAEKLIREIEDPQAAPEVCTVKGYVVEGRTVGTPAE